MAIIVAGSLKIEPGYREEFINRSIASVSLARDNDSCLDFAVSPDPIDENRVNIFELWTTRDALDRFRSSGPENDLFSMIKSFHVAEYETS